MIVCLLVSYFYHHFSYVISGLYISASFQSPKTPGFRPFTPADVTEAFNILNKVCIATYHKRKAGLGGSFGCAVRLETRRSHVQPLPRSATFFRGD